MPVWFDYWQERSERAEYLSVRISQLLDDCYRCSVDHWDTIDKYRKGMVRNRGWLETGQWSELAGIIEADFDALAALLQVHASHHYPTHSQHSEAEYLLGAHKRAVAFRHAALPTGPTLIGNLRSGGIV